MKGYVEKVDALIEKWGCEYVVRDRDTLLMEGDGGPLTVVTRCPNATQQDGINFYESNEYQELVKLRAPFTDWDFRLVQGKFWAAAAFPDRAPEAGQQTQLEQAMLRSVH